MSARNSDTMSAEKSDLDDFPLMDGDKPVRRTLGPSKKQREKEKPIEPEEEEQQHLLGENEENEENEEKEKPKVVLQTGVLAKLNLPPTDILSQYKNVSPVNGQGQEQGQEEKQDDCKEDEDKVHRTTLQSEMEAWDAVEQLRDQHDPAQGVQPSNGDSDLNSIITYDQALVFLRKDMSKKSEIKIHDYRNVGWFKSMQVSCFGKPSLSAELAKERDGFFCIAATQCDYTQPEHERIFQTIYRQLTGDTLTCPRLGSHWELIGFQGKDPATDLRGTGMLGPLQLLYMLKYYRSHALKIHRLSRDEIQSFPFAVVANNLSSMVMQSMREGSLHAKIKSKKNVWGVVNELFCALFYKFYLMWSQNACTIRNFAETKDLLTAEARKNPKKVISFFKKNQDLKKVEEAQLEFTEIP